MDCIFCDVIAGKLPSVKLYQDEWFIAISDLAPAAPVHALLIPREHIESAAALEERHKELLGHIWTKVPEIAKKLGVEESGFRIITNAGAHAGQTVRHLHFHLLGGRPLTVALG